MRTNFLKISLCVFLALFIVFSPIAYASNNIEPRQSDVTTTSENSDILASFETNYEIIYSDSYFYDNNVEVSQIIDGNVFAYGQTVNITGVIRGDLFVIADNLTISEEAIIQGNVFALANSTEISGEISDVYAMSSTFSLNNEGLIDRSIYLMANSVSLSGKITRDAYISTQNLSFDKNATNVIGGNLNYNSNNEIQLDQFILKNTAAINAYKEILEYNKKTNYLDENTISKINDLIKRSEDKININNNNDFINELKLKEKKINDIVNKIAWWIPVKKWRDNFRNNLLNNN